jgi:hypothetical protein
MTARREDPVLISSRREALLVLLIWLLAAIYSITVSYVWGYGRDAATLTYVLGFPDWVFWGVIAPWTACTVACYVMAYHVIRDDELGDEQAETQLASAARQEADHA